MHIPFDRTATRSQRNLPSVILSIFLFTALLLITGEAWAASPDAGSPPALGPQDAPVKVEVFYDFQCQHCGKTAPVLRKVVGQYGDLVRLVAINVPAPGHPYAESSAELALTAMDQGKFWEAFDLLFRNQARLAPDDLVEYGKQLGLDEKVVRKNLEESAHRDILKHDFYLALDLGLTATPTVFIGETKLVGVNDEDTFKYHINAELEKSGVASPVGPVARPAEKKGEEAFVVPPRMIYEVKTFAPVDSKPILAVGDAAPDFTLMTINDESASLSDYRGKKNVVLSFVPAAWTPVCSAQWPEYNQNQSYFDEADTAVIGITVDNIPTLFAWTGTMGDLWFDVASDFFPHGDVAGKYGVLRSNGVSERAVFLIDKNGTVRYIDVHDINSKPDFELLKAELAKLEK
ncbi:redoxin domain-containing protein [Thermodesulfobacteriota bacterium]